MHITLKMMMMMMVSLMVVVVVRNRRRQNESPASEAVLSAMLSRTSDVGAAYL